MKPTRLTQPYRKGAMRPPGQALDAMRLGAASTNPGAALAARAKATANAPRGRARKRKGVLIPHPSSPTGRNMRRQWPKRALH